MGEMRWLENGKIVILQFALCGMRAQHHQVLTQETPACFLSHIMVSPTTPAPGGPGRELTMANTGVPLAVVLERKTQSLRLILEEGSVHQAVKRVAVMHQINCNLSFLTGNVIMLLLNYTK